MCCDVTIVTASINRNSCSEETTSNYGILVSNDKTTAMRNFKAFKKNITAKNVFHFF